MRPLALLFLGAFAVLAPAKELTRTTVLVDGARANVGVPILEDCTYRIDLAKALDALTDGHAALKSAGANECRVLVDGAVRLSLSIGGNAESYARLPGGGRVRLTEPPFYETPKTGGRRIYLDIRALEQITGASIDLDGATLSMLTPEWWGHSLGIHQERLRGLNARSVGNAADFGITPPALNMLAWVRPPKSAFVQIFKGLANGTATPMFAVTPGGDIVVDDDTGSNLPAMVKSSPDVPARAPTRHLGPADRSYAMYAAVVASGDLGEEPIEAINAGSTGWSVVGMRQRVIDAPVTFAIEKLRPNERASELAARAQMPLELLLAMNGYGERAVPKPGAELIVIQSVQTSAGSASAPAAFGFYEARSGDTIESLATRWRVPAEAICRLNDMDEGEALDPGQVLVRVAPKDKPPTETCRVAPVDALARTKDETTLYRPDGRVLTVLSADQTVSIRGKSGSRYLVRYGTESDHQDGYLATNAVALLADPPERPLTLAGPREQRIRQVALAHLGTPYRWGGNDLSRGIDCSHFVAAVLTAAGDRPPAPPVAYQETVGRIVHWKACAALRGQAMRHFPDAQYPGQPSFDQLSIGDRVIIQHPPINQRAGGRHTGVFIGRYGSIKYAVVHAGSHGIAVVDIRHFWNDYRYTVHDEPSRRVALRTGRGRG